jgi:hypothetical protein
MKRKTFLLLSACIFLAAAHSPVFGGEFPLQGFIRTYIGVLLGDEYKFSIIQNTFDINIESAADRVGFKVNPYIYQQPLEDIEMNIREAYVDIYLNALDIRLGKQQIIWGKASGAFITDIVSPKDLREFLLPDFDEIRVGVTALRTDYYWETHTFEVVWIPVFVPTTPPQPGTIWAIAPSYSFPATINPEEEVETNFGNSELFGKYSYLGSFMDFELLGGYFWDDDQTLHITDRTFSGSELISMTLTPRHRRLALAGGTFSTAISGIVIRGEAGYYFGKSFNTNEPADVDGVVQKDFINYVVGVDFSLLDINMNFQFIQKLILNYDEQIVHDRFDNLLTLLIYRDLLREAVHAELFAYVGINNPDALLRPKLSYELADGFSIDFGGNIFLGNRGQFGQYNDNDMIFTKVTYSF